MTLPVAILAGGLATRLGGLAADRPKLLVDVAGRPFAEHQIAQLRREGVTRIVYCVGHKGDQIREALGDGSRWGMTFEYVADGPALVGTGGAIRQALPLLGDAFFVMYGDSYLDCRFTDIEAAFRASGQPGLMTVFRNENQWDTSNVVYERGRIVDYDKANRTPAMRHIDYGLGVFSAAAFERYPPGDPLDLMVVYRDLLRDGRLAGYEVAERFYEIGSPAGLQETREMLAARSGTVS